MALHITNEDNLALMARYPDNYFNLAIVDPPYGIKAGGVYDDTVSRKHGNSKAKRSAHKINWDDEIPSEEFFIELLRVSKHQIIWGINYFKDYAHLFGPGRIFWDKDNGNNDFSDGEIAYQSFTESVKKVKIRWSGMLQQDMKNKEIRIHGTQKPVALYKWLLHKYAKPGFHILDTHLGSMSIAIACAEYGFDLTGCEVDKEIFDKGMKRVNGYLNQTKIIF